MANDFKVFAAGAGANALTPAAWAALTTLLSQGFQTGTANSQQANTAWRQATSVAAAIGQFISNNGGNAVDDGNITNLTAAFQAAITALSLPAASNAQTQAGTATNVAVTPASLASAVLGGVGQNWVIRSGMAYGTSYVNSTARPRVVIVSGQTTSSTTNMFGVVGGGTIIQQGTSFSGIGLFLIMIVPPGASYSVGAVNNTLQLWAELG